MPGRRLGLGGTGTSSEGAPNVGEGIPRIVMDAVAVDVAVVVGVHVMVAVNDPADVVVGLLNAEQTCRGGANGRIVLLSNK